MQVNCQPQWAALEGGCGRRGAGGWGLGGGGYGRPASRHLCGRGGPCYAPACQQVGWDGRLCHTACPQHTFLTRQPSTRPPLHAPLPAGSSSSPLPPPAPPSSPAPSPSAASLRPTWWVMGGLVAAAVSRAGVRFGTQRACPAPTAQPSCPPGPAPPLLRPAAVRADDCDVCLPHRGALVSRVKGWSRDWACTVALPACRHRRA